MIPYWRMSSNPKSGYISATLDRFGMADANPHPISLLTGADIHLIKNTLQALPADLVKASSAAHYMFRLALGQIFLLLYHVLAQNCGQMLVLRSHQWLWPSWLFQFQSGWSDWWPPLQLWLCVYAYEQPNFLVFVQKEQLFSNMNTYRRNGCQWLYQVILACPTSLLLTLS